MNAYQVLANNNLNRLESLVNEEMIKGWEPLGSVGTASNGFVRFWYQTMARTPMAPLVKTQEKP